MILPFVEYFQLIIVGPPPLPTEILCPHLGSSETFDLYSTVFCTSCAKMGKNIVFFRSKCYCTLKQ